jgi:hypothetical protein
MALIHDILIEKLPAKKKKTPRGWIVFNSPCCEHRGHKPDKRSRGNLLALPDGTVGFNCYNCGFRTRANADHLSKNFELLLKWMKVSDQDIGRIKLEILKNQLDGVQNTSVQNSAVVFRNFEEVELPTGAMPIQSVLQENNVPEDFIFVMNYLIARGSDIANGYDYYWSPDSKNHMNRRIIVPFYHNNKIVGWTGRYAGVPPAGVTRYWNSQLPKGYLFNGDLLDIANRKYAILTEGPFDAIALDAIAVLGSELSREQVAWINQSNKEIVVAPDRQRKNQGLIDAALENNWSVAFPDWEDDIKDAADAVKKYGRLYALQSIIKTKTRDDLEIGIKRKMFRNS